MPAALKPAYYRVERKTGTFDVFVKPTQYSDVDYPRAEVLIPNGYKVQVVLDKGTPREIRYEERMRKFVTLQEARAYVSSTVIPQLPDTREDLSQRNRKPVGVMIPELDGMEPTLAWSKRAGYGMTDPLAVRNVENRVLEAARNYATYQHYLETGKIAVQEPMPEHLLTAKSPTGNSPKVKATAAGKAQPKRKTRPANPATEPQLGYIAGLVTEAEHKGRDWGMVKGWFAFTAKMDSPEELKYLDKGEASEVITSLKSQMPPGYPPKDVKANGEVLKAKLLAPEKKPKASGAKGAKTVQAKTQKGQAKVTGGKQKNTQAIGVKAKQSKSTTADKVALKKTVKMPKTEEAPARTSGKRRGGGGRQPAKSGSNRSNVTISIE